jgi:exopolysaccharide biosynthesis polyprenyl glycosylphosphotransferase
MKSDGVLALLKAFDLTVFVMAFVLVAAPTENSGPFAFIASAVASDALRFGFASDALHPSFASAAIHLGFTGYGPPTLHELLSIQVSVQGLLLTSSFLAFLHIIFSSLGLYSPDRVGRNSPRDLIDFLTVALLGTAAISIAPLVIDLSRGVSGAFSSAFIAACGVILLTRLGVNSLVRRAKRKSNARRHVVIVGTNRRAIELARKIVARRTGGMKLVGFVDQHWAGDEEFRRTGYRVVSDFVGFQDFLKDHVVDEVFICTPLKSLYDKSARVFKQCELQGITVRFRSDPVSPSIGRSWIDEFEGQPVLTVNSTPAQQVSLYVKRLVDVVASAVLLLSILPLLLLIALAIKLTSDGPVFFSQERVGLNKRRFRLYKFRTMGIDAERRLASLEPMNEVTGPVFKIEHDPRVTPVGRFLRKSSLDELPQLFNVLKGEMSLVGPRPLAVRDYRGITEDWQRRRLSVPPGITCLWQVQGRNSIAFDRWMELDLEYIDNWSLLLDLKICMMTIPAVMSGAGAS